MKIFSLLILLTNVFFTYSQQSSYKHKYQITPYLESHHNSVHIDTLPYNSQFNLHMTFTDHDDMPLKNIEIILKNVDTNLVLATDSNGTIDLNTDFKIFKIDVNQSEYQKIQSLILLQNHHLISYKIKLCELADLNDKYYIKSKSPLSEDEISEIRDCIETNDKVDGCNMEGDYIIVVENKKSPM